MVLLEAIQINKYYGERLIFELPLLNINEGDRIGIVGANGAGKTTLLNVLSGALLPDEGLCRQYCEIAYIRQFGVEGMTAEGVEANEKTIHEFSMAGKTDREALSGGEKTRLKIANALSMNRRLLFADEPTANLDYKGISLLKQKLAVQDSLVLISHDRDLLDTLCNKILEIKDGVVRLFSGNYSAYLEQREADFARKEFEYEQYANEKSRLQDAISQVKAKAGSVRKAPRRMGNSEARLHKREATETEQKLNNAAKSLKSRMDRLEVKEKPREVPIIKLDFSLTNPPQNKILVSGKDVNFHYEHSVVIFEKAAFEIKNNAKTAIIGENGAGKSTLINLITKGHPGIYTVPKARFGYLYQGFENLDYDKTVLQNAMKDSIQGENATRNILGRLLLRGSDVFKKVEVLSGGEKIKLALAKLLVSDANVLLLDEPTNYLDIPSIEGVQDLLRDYEGAVVFVSHDKAFVNGVADHLLIIENKKITGFEGNLDLYEASRKKSPKRSENKMLLEFRLTQVLSELSLKNADKEALQLEFESICEKLKDLKG